MTRFHTCTAALAAMMLSLGSAALAQEADTAMPEDWWAGWDTNADGILSDQEFRAGIYLNDPHGQMDGDGDGMVSAEELPVGYMSEETFAEQDKDGDGMLTEEELMEAIMLTYDTNGDLLYNPEEMNMVAQELGALLTAQEV